MKELIREFINYLGDHDVELYNEAGLQHELGYFLRVVKKIPVKFEYNVQSVLGTTSINLLKKEMDIYFETNNQKNCIELKFPNKGAYPRRMTQSIIDIYFLQQLLNNGFSTGLFLFITDLVNFTKGDFKDGIYSYFRNHKDISLFSPEDIPPFFIKKNDGKIFYEVIKGQTFKPLSPVAINFEEQIISGKKYYYFFIEMNKKPEHL